MSKAENARWESLRSEFAKKGLTKKDVADDPLEQFGKWLAEAETAEVLEPNAMALATVGTDGRPSARTVLLKGADSRGFRFFTNLEGRKAQEIMARPWVTLVFHWKELDRQIIVTGTVSKVMPEEAEEYFHSRPYQNKIGTWTSRQGHRVDRRSVLDKRASHLMKRYPEGSEVPFPEFWGGFFVRPVEVEFWQARPGRLHDRIVYRQPDDPSEKKWEIIRIAP